MDTINNDEGIQMEKVKIITSKYLCSNNCGHKVNVGIGLPDSIPIYCPECGETTEHIKQA